MAKKKKINPIIEEQRRARQEFIELKKMQSGEIEPPKALSAEEVLPKTFSEKFKNFWFYHKIHVFLILAAALVLSVLITQCAGREKYDMEIVLFTYNTYSANQTKAIEEYIQKNCADYDNNGEVNISVIDCSFDDNSSDYQFKTTQLTKLQTVFAAQREVALFVVDENSLEYLNGLVSEGNVFVGEPVKVGSDLYEQNKDLSLSENLFLVRRDYGENPEKSVQTAITKADETINKIANPDR